MNDLKEFEVEVTEILKKKVIVKAKDPKDAEEQAELDWDNGVFTLDYNDFDKSNFTTISEIERGEKTNMKEFDIEITETLKRTVTVQAENADEAMDLVHDRHSQGIYVLDADNFDDMTIETKQERDIMLDVLLVEPMKPPVNIQIPNTLEALQDTVGGLIETAHFYDEPVVVICNEEGKINGLQLNRAIYDEQGEIMEVVAGSFLLVGDGDEDFISLPKEMKDKFAKEFEKPEKFHQLAGKIIVQKIETQKDNVKKPELER